MVAEDKKTTIRHLWLFGTYVEDLQKLSEQMVADAPAFDPPESLREYVEPFLVQLDGISSSIIERRGMLLNRGVDIPDGWLSMPIKLAYKGDPDSRHS
jgi:hypothetical protein